MAIQTLKQHWHRSHSCQIWGAWLILDYKWAPGSSFIKSLAKVWQPGVENLGCCWAVSDIFFTNLLSGLSKLHKDHWELLVLISHCVTECMLWWNDLPGTRGLLCQCFHYLIDVQTNVPKPASLLKPHSPLAHALPQVAHIWNRLVWWGANKGQAGRQHIWQRRRSIETASVQQSWLRSKLQQMFLCLLETSQPRREKL